jgi:hypothetical protein
MEFIFSSVVVLTTSKGVNWRTDNMYSGPKEMDKRINNDLENITQKSKHWTTSTPLKPDFLLEDNNTLLKNILSFAARWRDIVLAITLWFKVKYSFTIMSLDDVVYYLVFKR